MDEDNDNDQTPKNNKKDIRPLRPKPETEATRHKISDIKQLKLILKKMKKKLFKKLIYSIY